MSAVKYLSQGDTGPVLVDTLERETTDGVFEAEDLTGCAVTLSLFRANNTTYKSGLAVTIVDAVAGQVSYAWAVGDSKQGALTGKYCVTYPGGVQVSFPNTGPFQIRVSR